MNKTLWFFGFFLTSIVAFSQHDVQKSQEIETFNGKPYYIHTIEHGQTVFSISRAYGVTTEEIFEANSFAREGLKQGHLLRIPVKSEKPDNQNVPSRQTADTLYLLDYIASEDLLLSQIAKRFEISFTDILRFNTIYETKEIIRKNDSLLLPVVSIDIIVDYLLSNPKAVVRVLIPHQISRGETLYSISKEYGTTVSNIKHLNPGLEETISTGQIIYVPLKKLQEIHMKSDTAEKVEKQVKTTVQTKAECMRITGKKQYRVALLLPLYLEQAESIVINPSPRQNVGIDHKSFDYIQFYEGFLLALNKLELNNATIQLDVYDVTDGEDKISRLASRGLLDVDLIIGPFMRKPLEKLSQWSHGKNVKILDLYMPDEVDYSIDNPLLMSAIPSVSEQLRGLMIFIRDFDPDKNVIVVNSTNQNENLIVEKIRDIQEKGIGYQIQFYPYGSGGISELVRMLNPDKHNIVLNFSNNEIFLNSFSRALFDNADNYRITLFGLPSWLRFQSIDYRYLNHFNTHFISSHFVDYSKQNVRDFVSEFQATYLTDPNRMAFLGHDVATYVLELLTAYGNDFHFCTHLHSPELLSTNFLFERQGENGQFQNMHVSIYEIIDFQLFDSRRKPGKND